MGNLDETVLDEGGAQYASRITLGAPSKRIKNVEVHQLVTKEHYIPPPNKLITATGGGLPSLCFVCPQYANTYFDGCQVTVGDGARAGTRCSGIVVSVAH